MEGGRRRAPPATERRRSLTWSSNPGVARPPRASGLASARRSCWTTVLPDRSRTHPVSMDLSSAELFVPNDLLPDTDVRPQNPDPYRPNGGKSTYLPACGLSWSSWRSRPRSFRRRGLDRAGRPDRSASSAPPTPPLGQEHFLVGDDYTANILTTPTPRSLILLDEVGRARRHSTVAVDRPGRCRSPARHACVAGAYAVATPLSTS